MMRPDFENPNAGYQASSTQSNAYQVSSSNTGGVNQAYQAQTSHTQNANGFFATTTHTSHHPREQHALERSVCDACKIV